MLSFFTGPPLMAVIDVRLLLYFEAIGGDQSIPIDAPGAAQKANSR
jgi:hypothetical protein